MRNAALILADVHVCTRSYCAVWCCKGAPEQVHLQGCIQKFRLGGGGKLKLLNILRGFMPRGFLSYPQETILNIWNRKPRRILNY